MPRILTFPANIGSNCYIGKLPPSDEDGNKLPPPRTVSSFLFDGRPILLDRHGFHFRVILLDPYYVEITRLDKGAFQDKKEVGWDCAISFRMYEKDLEILPDFQSTTYTYHGLKKEKPPATTTSIVFADDVAIVRKHAFAGLPLLENCIFGSKVRLLCQGAFAGCPKLIFVVLSPVLEFIGMYTFKHCTSLHHIFIPKSIMLFGHGAFTFCRKLRFVVFENHHTMEDFRLGVFFNSFGVFFEDDFYSRSPINMLKRRYEHLPMHIKCFDPHVTAQDIIECKKKFSGLLCGIETDSHYNQTALHLMMLCNLNASNEAILACMETNIFQLVMKDYKQRTPMDLAFMTSRIDLLTSFIVQLCRFRIFN